MEEGAIERFIKEVSVSPRRRQPEISSDSSVFDVTFSLYLAVKWRPFSEEYACMCFGIDAVSKA